MPKSERVINRVVDWLAAGTGDLADSVEKLNRDLENRESNPRWTRAVVKDTLVILSPRRWLSFRPRGHQDLNLDDFDPPRKTGE
ncbi:MAG: hypothetical protein JWP00_2918 [Chloroflexi bacterium]|jgi:hypothetical protein|nr:hypothetical protein [Chloroflexota bacterium]